MKVQVSQKAGLDDIEYLQRDLKEVVTKREWTYVLDEINKKANTSQVILLNDKVDNQIEIVKEVLLKLGPFPVYFFNIFVITTHLTETIYNNGQ